MSELVLQEIENNTNQDLKDKMFTLLDSISPIVLEIEEEVLLLAEKYRNHIIKNEINDSIHIATASVNKLDAIVSWNFRHIENLGGDSYGNI